MIFRTRHEKIFIEKLKISSEQGRFVLFASYFSKENNNVSAKIHIRVTYFSIEFDWKDSTNFACFDRKWIEFSENWTPNQADWNHGSKYRKIEWRVSICWRGTSRTLSMNRTNQMSFFVHSLDKLVSIFNLWSEIHGITTDMHNINDGLKLR